MLKDKYIISDKVVVDKVVEGIQERKGKQIVVVDFNRFKDAPCQYFVICEGDSSTHVNSIAVSIKDYVNEKIKISPFAVDGLENSEWIAIDYGQIIVHVFQRASREFYDLEHLWADAQINYIENLN